MFGSTVLDVAIGLTFTYLLLSLVCSAINEFIARLCFLRSGTLKHAIDTMLPGKDVFGSPIIQALCRKSWLWKVLNRDVDLHPSYISAKTFSQAVLDTFAPTPVGASQRSFRDVRKAIDTLVAPPGSPPAVAAAFDSSRRTLLGLIDAGNGTLKEAQEQIEQWFDDSMKEVTGWYRRKYSWILFAVAAIVTVVFNVDTIEVATMLWKNRTIREAAVKAAENYVKTNKPPGDATTTPPAATPPASPGGSGGASLPARPAQSPAPQPTADLAPFQVSVAQTEAGAPPATSPTPKPKTPNKQPETGPDQIADVVNKVNEQFATIGLPVGWSAERCAVWGFGTKKSEKSTGENSEPKKAEDSSGRSKLQPSGPDYGAIGQDLLGWLLTTIAVSLGAPFWFDLLNKFVNLRSGGNRP